MKHLDLFSGIGGFALAARWMGWHTIQFVEIDKFCQKVLQKNFPGISIHDDIKSFDGKQWAGKVDILTGGFPCQPYSAAGKRLGKEDERHLWPEMLRVIGEVQPPYIVGENVYGLVNWSGGLVFNEVQSDLENKGYEVAPVILPACAVNAPHRRDRIWFVAYSDSNRKSIKSLNDCERVGQLGASANSSSKRVGGSWGGRDASRELLQEGEREQSQLVDQRTGCTGIIANASDDGHTFEGRSRVRNERRILQEEHENGCESVRRGDTSSEPNDWGVFPTQSAVCRRDDGIPNRVDRIKSLGNAIVPQVAFEIFKALNP